MSASSDRSATVLITNYNYGRFLEYAVDSALDQTWPNVQVIVVDDGSTDESRLLLQTYGEAIQTVFKENGGQASSANTGFPLVTGETVVFLDSDDMLAPTAIEKSIGFFDDPEVVKVSWPMAIVDANGYPTGEVRFRRLSVGNYRKRALRVGPASHHTPSTSANIWRKTFLDQVMPIPEEDCKNIIDAWFFTFSPFFGTFQAIEEPLTFYRVHGKNFSTDYAAGKRLVDWEHRARHLHAFLVEQGEDVSIDRWRRKNEFYQRLKGILRGEAKIGKLLPVDEPIVLVAGRYYDRDDIRPARPVYRPPDDIRSPQRTEADFRAFIDDVCAMGVAHLAIQGPSTWTDTNLPALVELLRAEHTILYEDKWIAIARLDGRDEGLT